MYVYERLSALLVLEFAVPSHRIDIRARLVEDLLMSSEDIWAYSQCVQALFPLVGLSGQAVAFTTLEQSVLAVEGAYGLTLDGTLALIRPVLAARLGTNRFDYDTPLGQRFNRHDRAAVVYDLQNTFDIHGVIGRTFTAVGDLVFYLETQLYRHRLAAKPYELRPPEAPPAHTLAQLP